MSSIKIYLQTVIALVSATTSYCSARGFCEPTNRVELHNTVKLDNASIWDSDNQVLYPPNSYWDHGGDNGTIYGCPCKLEKPCMRKCCQKKEAMDYDTLQCIPHNATWPWFRPNVPADEVGNYQMEDFDYFGLTFGNYCFGYILEPQFYPEDDQFYVNFTDGTLSIINLNKTGLGTEDYCLEYFPQNDTYLPYVCFHTVSVKNPLDPCKDLRYIFYPLGMFISIVFLIISLAIFSVVPALRNFHGKCLMCHMASLLFAYIFLATVQGLGSFLSEDVCQSFGLLIYFWLLCSFFWLNIMCIDIYIAFSSIRPMTTAQSERDMKKFLIYMLYAWGIPLVILVITAVIELHPDIPDIVYKPNFRVTCWFSSDESRMAYFIIPIGVIVLCNIILFLITARNIFVMSSDTNLLTHGDNRRHDRNEDRSRFKLYIKLSVVMGISWATEIISWIAGGSTCIWLFTDTLNTLQGFFIFFIFVWKRKVRHLIKMKFCSKEVNNRSIQMDGGSNEDQSASTSSTNAPSSNGSGPMVNNNVTNATNDKQTPPVEEEPEIEITRL